jgi:hypothetical protein
MIHKPVLGPNEEERVGHRVIHTPTNTTPDGRWLWDGEGWVEARLSWPASVRRVHRTWFASITALWLLTWIHPWATLTSSFAVFAAACAVTVVFGGVLARRGEEWLIRRAAFSGVLVLGLASITAFGVSAAISVGGGVDGFLGVILGVTVFGSIVIIGLGTGGFWLLVFLLKSGAKLSTRLQKGAPT